MDTPRIKPPNKFNFDEIIKLKAYPDLPDIFWDTWGQIAGMSYDDECDQWGYSVIIFDDNMLVWDLPESAIRKGIEQQERGSDRVHG